MLQDEIDGSIYKTADRAITITEQCFSIRLLDHMYSYLLLIDSRFHRHSFLINSKLHYSFLWLIIQHYLKYTLFVSFPIFFTI